MFSQGMPVYGGQRWSEIEHNTLLEKVTVDAVIDNLLSRVKVFQEYHNIEETNIEAVYTFPLPVNGVLLDLEVTIGERKLKGLILERHEASDKYEDAIADGDTTIMLEQPEPGMYVMNVGNLQAGEKVRISFTYAELLRWQDGSLRFFLPTTIAPRYGSPQKAGLEGHQVPEIDLLTENRFSIELKLRGALAKAEIDSPSHAVQILRDAEEIQVLLNNGQAFMDRDFVCQIKLDERQRNMSLIGQDVNGYVAMASLTPEFSKEDEGSRNVTLVVDCSGSMAGDSIAQARRAMKEILGLLRPQDRFNIIAFGTGVRPLFATLAPADTEHLVLAKRFIRSLDANMGGTEIGLAIKKALVDPDSQNILLVTDGEVWNSEEVVAKACKSGCRFFTIGVGSSVAEGFVRTLAKKTGGACELAVPNEDMGEKIVRQAHRIFNRRCEKVSVEWPGTPTEKIPLTFGAVFAGDTVAMFARYSEMPTGLVRFSCEIGGGLTSFTEVNLTDKLNLAGSSDSEKPYSVLARLVANETLSNLNEDQALATCLQYQLMSDKTNYLVVDVRDECDQAKKLPALRKVSNMQAAGWGGVGTVACSAGLMVGTSCWPVRMKPSGALLREDHVSPDFLQKDECIEDECIEDDVIKGSVWQSKFVIEIEKYFFGKNIKKLTRLDELAAMELDVMVIEDLQKIVQEGFSEEDVVALFLLNYAGDLYKSHFPQQPSRVIRRIYKEYKVRGYRVLSTKMTKLLEAVTV